MTSTKKQRNTEEIEKLSKEKEKMAQQLKELVSYCKNPKIRTPEKFTVITLKFEQSGFTIDYLHLPQTSLR